MTDFILDVLKYLLWMTYKITLFVYFKLVLWSFPRKTQNIPLGFSLLLTQTPLHWWQKTLCHLFYTFDILHAAFFFGDLWLQRPYAREHRAPSGGRCMLAEKGRVDVNTCWGCVHGWDYSGMPAVEAKLHCRSWEDFPHTFSSSSFFFLDPDNSQASATTPDSLTFSLSNRCHGNCFTSHKLQ